MKFTTITVFEDDDLGEPPTNPVEFMDFWKQKIALIPEEFKKNARIELEPETRWECGYLVLKITYTRPETKDEKRSRIDADRNRENIIKERDLKQLAKLKKQYEGV